MRRLLLVVPAILASGAGCGDDKTTDIKCSGGVQGSLALGSPVTVTGGDDLSGAAIAADDHTTLPAGAVSIACADDIVPSGYIALGPAVAFGAEGTWSDRPFELTLPYKMARMPADGKRGNVRIVAKRPGGDAFFPPVSNRTLDDTDTFASKATFRGGELTTYQVVARSDAGKTHMEQFGWNAITGVSMGGNAAMAIALRHPDRFDVFGDMGGEPGPSQVYTLSMVRDFVYGGFCDAASGKLGQLCPNHSTKPEQFETESDFEHMLYQAGSGVGLTLDRSLYMKGTRDMARALSNPALYNPTNAYAPPGVDFSYFATQPAMRCDPTHTVTLTGFYDREFNPAGDKPVITFCDGGDSMAKGLGVFDAALPQQDPAELVLAVDLDGNGKRDPGEPVITNAYEPFQDVGSDGLADKDEPGYDVATNPDPNHDDYHYLRNPNGTEGNGTRDEGEPYEDVGLDGVASTCQAPATGCYDYGEGNGAWDVSPNVLNWYKNDFNRELAALTPDQRDHMSMWFDAGVRDFLNNSVSTNQAVGRAMGAFGSPFGVYDGFGGLVAGASDATYDFTEVNWQDLPKHGYLRYGNPDASISEIMAGDGRHVGTANQAIYRIETAFAFIDKHLPDGDRDDSYDGGQTLMDQSFVSPTTGRDSPYAMFLPPGYNDPANATKRYPVVYVLHGYGQQPNDLVALSAVIANHMIATEPLETRIQKFIMVFVDGRCRPSTDGVPVDPTGDLCEQGTFYVDAPLGGKARAETNLLDLMDHIDATYRTKQASAAEVAN
ncbi:MAG: alpha/beta hydrolase-fold protein [Deltaproteobacteria bacterium]